MLGLPLFLFPLGGILELKSHNASAIIFESGNKTCELRHQGGELVSTCPIRSSGGGDDDVWREIERIKEAPPLLHVPS